MKSVVRMWFEGFRAHILKVSCRQHFDLILFIAMVVAIFAFLVLVEKGIELFYVIFNR